VQSLKVGAGQRGKASQGPLIDAAALAKVEAHIADAVAKGARVLTGGRRHALGGTFFEPTVLADVTPAMRVAREETFGPVAPVFRFKSEARGDRHGQRHRVRPRRLLLSRDVARCCASAKRSSTAWSASTPA
jgi:succinate-semialdehyde dehydrogenase/glutarate-semialdehyde dehydrogenase